MKFSAYEQTGLVLSATTVTCLKKKKEERPCDEDSNSQFHGMHQVLLPAKEVERWAKMVGTEESKLWPLDDDEEQLKTYHLITNSKLHHYRMTNGHSKCVALTLSRSDMKFSLAALCYGYPKPVWFCPVVGSCCEKFIPLQQLACDQFFCSSSLDSGFWYNLGILNLRTSPSE